MAQLTSSQNPGVNLANYLYGDPIQKTSSTSNPDLLDFSLHDPKGLLVLPKRGAYIRLVTNTYGVLFTGFCTSDPSPALIGSQKGKPRYEWKYQCSSDEYILNLHALGIIPPFVNENMGNILKRLISLLTPDSFPIDVSNIGTGVIIPRYTVDPSQHFSDVVTDFCTSTNYRFEVVDQKAYFQPMDVNQKSVLVDANSKYFTPSKLEVSATADPIVNDVIVTGGVEPQGKMVELFVSDGATAQFPLASSVYGTDSALILDETFNGTSIDSAKWTVYDPTNLNLVQAGGLLNCLGGNRDNTSVRIEAANLIPLEGHVKITHGEFTFSRPSSGLLGAIFPKGLSGNLNNAIYGITVVALNAARSSVVNAWDSAATYSRFYPFKNGTDYSRWMDIGFSRNYIIKTQIDFKFDIRQYAAYIGLNQNGEPALATVAPGYDTANVQTTITEIDPSTGKVTNRVVWNDSLTTAQSQAVYALMVSQELHCTVSNTTISMPMQVLLQHKAPDKPVGNNYTGSGGTLSISPNPAPPGTATLTITWTNSKGNPIDIRRGSPTGPTVFNPFYYFTDQPANGSANFSPNDGVMTPGTEFYLIDKNTSQVLAYAQLSQSATISQPQGNPYVAKLIGPNELDDQSGALPVATITGSNSGVTTKQSNTGSTNLNPGQATLSYYKSTEKLESNIPPAGTRIRLEYQRPGAAIGRTQDPRSVNKESAGWGDDGVRSLTRNDLNPAPRTSYDCELAAAALVQANSYQHYSGNYTMPSGPWFTEEPKAGAVVKFLNMSRYPDTLPSDLVAEPITQVVTTFDHSLQKEYFTHKISFGPMDALSRLLRKFKRQDSVFAPKDSVEIPDAQHVLLTGTPTAAAVPFIDNWASGGLNQFYRACENLYYNPTMLTGLFPSVTAGTVSLQSSNRSTNNYMVQVGAGSAAYQDITGLTPGVRYYASAWVQGSSPSATAKTASIYFHDIDNQSTILAAAYQDSRTVAWQQIKANFIAPSNGKVRFHMYNGEQSGSLNFEAPVLTSDPNNFAYNGNALEVRYSDSQWGPDSGTNLVCRSYTGNFGVPRNTRGRLFYVKAYSQVNYQHYSDDLTGWPSISNTTATLVQQRDSDGDLSYVSKLVSGGSNGNKYQAAYVCPKANEYFTATALVKGAKGSWVQLNFGGTHGDGSPEIVYGPQVTLTGGWQEVSWTYKFTANCEQGLNTGINFAPNSTLYVTKVQAQRSNFFGNGTPTNLPLGLHKNLLWGYGPLSKYAYGVHNALPLIPLPPTATVDVTDIRNPVISLNLPAALQDVWGIEIRASDNTTVLIRYDLTDPDYYQSVAGNSTAKPNYANPKYILKGNTSRSGGYYVYTYNILGEYSTGTYVSFDKGIPNVTYIAVDNPSKVLVVVFNNAVGIHVDIQRPAGTNVYGLDVPTTARSGTFYWNIPDDYFFKYGRFFAQAYDEFGRAGAQLSVDHTYQPAGVVEFNANEVAYITPPTNNATDVYVPPALSKWTRQVIEKARELYVKNKALK